MKESVLFRPLSKHLKKAAVCLLAIAGIGLGALAMNQMEKKDISPHPQFTKVDLSPVRGDFKPLRLHRTGFEYKCSECHRTFGAPSVQEKRVAEHTELTLNHGSNNYCLNCHHKTNRDAYTNHDGSEIPPDQPALLCAKCHGPTYNDWLLGAHGRISGTWKPGAKEAKRLLCIQCHDPHNPKFPKLKPMPGPSQGQAHASGGEA